MIPDGFKNYLQNTYKEDEFGHRAFDYTPYALGRICRWGDKWQPDSIQLFKQILERIKDGVNDPENNYFHDSANKKGWYVPLPLVSTDKEMVVFFELPQLPGKTYFRIYEFKIVAKEKTNN